MTVTEQLDELRKLLELTGASGIQDALGKVECWRYNEENRQQLEQRWTDESKQAIDTLMECSDKVPPFFHQAFTHAVLVLMHESSMARDEIVRLRAQLRDCVEARR